MVISVGNKARGIKKGFIIFQKKIFFQKSWNIEQMCVLYWILSFWIFLGRTFLKNVKLGPYYLHLGSSQRLKITSYEKRRPDVSREISEHAKWDKHNTNTFYGKVKPVFIILASLFHWFCTGPYLHQFFWVLWALFAAYVFNKAQKRQHFWSQKKSPRYFSKGLNFWEKLDKRSKMYVLINL